MGESGKDAARAGPGVASDRGALRGITDFVACVEALLLDVELELEAVTAQIVTTSPDPRRSVPRSPRAGPRGRDRRVVRRRPGT
jgi:hypothetical protein